MEGEEVCVKQLKWRCRRGTKELDFILTRFLGDCYNSLTSKEVISFSALLDLQDPDLANYLIYFVKPPSEYDSIIQRIRSSTRS